MTETNDIRYAFNAAGELKDKETGEGFKYTNEPEYVKIGDYVVSYLQQQMEQVYNLVRVNLPSDDQPDSYVYMSANPSQFSAVLFLIQGSGAVRPGMWARSLCINVSLEMGSVLPMLHFAQARNWGVVVFNPNESTFEMGEHCCYVYNTVIKRDFTNMDSIYIVGHSAGGYHTFQLLSKNEADMVQYVKGIALTDAVHSYHDINSPQLYNHINSCMVHWKCSGKPLNTLLSWEGKRGMDGRGCRCVSAGTKKHEWSTGTCQREILKMFAVIADGGDFNTIFDEQETKDETPEEAAHRAERERQEILEGAEGKLELLTNQLNSGNMTLLDTLIPMLGLDRLKPTTNKTATDNSPQEISIPPMEVLLSQCLEKMPDFAILLQEKPEKKDDVVDLFSKILQIYLQKISQ